MVSAAGKSSAKPRDDLFLYGDETPGFLHEFLAHPLSSAPATKTKTNLTSKTKHMAKPKTEMREHEVDLQLDGFQGLLLAEKQKQLATLDQQIKLKQVEINQITKLQQQPNFQFPSVPGPAGFQVNTPVVLQNDPGQGMSDGNPVFSKYYDPEKSQNPSFGYIIMFLSVWEGKVTRICRCLNSSMVTCPLSWSILTKFLPNSILTICEI